RCVELKMAVPSEMTVGPPYVLVEPRTSVPLPSLTSADPASPETTPVIDSVEVGSATVITLGPPARSTVLENTSGLLPATMKVLATLTRLPILRRAPTATIVGP